MFTEINGKAWDVLRPFLDDPGLEASLRGLSRRSGVSVRWVAKTVETMQQQDILTVRDEPAAKRVSTGPRFTAVKRFYNLDQLQQSGLIDHLNDTLYPDCIVLFGSYDKGEDTRDSDIDLAIIGGRDQQPDLDDYKKELARTITLHFLDTADEGDTRFRNSLANGTVLTGFLKVV